jgi:predicted ester cyclase
MRPGEGQRALPPSPSSERVLRAGSPDLHVEIEDLLAEGDQVIAATVASSSTGQSAMTSGR